MSDERQAPCVECGKLLPVPPWPIVEGSLRCIEHVLAELDAEWLERMSKLEDEHGGFPGVSGAARHLRRETIARAVRYAINAHYARMPPETIEAIVASVVASLIGVPAPR